MIDLEHKLKPFIPDFIPAVGDIDAFLKVCCVCLCVLMLPQSAAWKGGQHPRWCFTCGSLRGSDPPLQAVELGN